MHFCTVEKLSFDKGPVSYLVSMRMCTYIIMFGMSPVADNSFGMLNPRDRALVVSWFPHYGQSQLNKYNGFNISLEF